MLVNRAFEALAHVRRREVLRILRKHDRLSAGQLAEQLAVPRPTLSGHLNVLKGADLIIGDREGTTIWYRLNMTVMEETVELVLSLLSRGSAPALPVVSLDQADRPRVRHPFQERLPVSGGRPTVR